MAGRRTQIYLSEQQRAGLDALRRIRGGSLADQVRAAVDGYLAKQQLDPEIALEATFGVARDASVPFREEWGTREPPSADD